MLKKELKLLTNFVSRQKNFLIYQTKTLIILIIKLMKAPIHIYKNLYLCIYASSYIPLHIQRVCSALYLIISPPFPQLLLQSYNVSMYHTQYKPNPTLYSLNIPIHSSNIIIFPTLYSTSLNVYILVCSLVLHPRKSKERKRNITPYLHILYAI